MEWMDTLRELAETPGVQWAAEALVRGIARRVRRGGRSAAAHSEAGPATAAGDTEGTETVMTTVTGGKTGEELAEDLLRGVGNEWMRAATRLLGGHRDGYWLRRFLDKQDAQPEHLQFLDRSGTHPSVNWDGIGHRLMSEFPLTDTPPIQGSRSEMAVLRIATSLAGATPLNLQASLDALDETELRLVQRAITEAATGVED
ncbi:hypothetical protein C5L38_33815 (plasmid) [Streptomyces sp. WAC00288]|uniref:hypothetical protein n=1 Tax=unclassified Streptomyces TaxID=2593676 RepID=UPI000786CEFE|nr:MULTISPECIES: hypothetical protein [unclassified Streptomyces]AVI00058.1 hypothetical protein C5L38_33815 [Streptomyces sp. WAC00288]KYG51123.1 hypothetical protein AWI43_32240 [Streptomyces sp. WAC04657]